MSDPWRKQTVSHLRQHAKSIGVETRGLRNRRELWDAIVLKESDLYCTTCGVAHVCHRCGLNRGAERHDVPLCASCESEEVMPDPMSVHEAIGRVKRAIRAVPKNRQSDPAQGGYSFRGIEGVLGAVHEPMAEAGVFMVPCDLEVSRETWPHFGGGKWHMTRVRVEWTIYGPAGDSITTVNWGEALDNADKGLGKARSYAQKDLLIRLFTIPTSDADVGDTEATQYSNDEPEPVADPDPELTDEEKESFKKRIASLTDDDRAKLSDEWNQLRQQHELRPMLRMRESDRELADALIAQYETAQPPCEDDDTEAKVAEALDAAVTDTRPL